jgi:hypothetical protein
MPRLNKVRTPIESLTVHRDSLRSSDAVLEPKARLRVWVHEVWGNIPDCFASDSQGHE